MDKSSKQNFNKAIAALNNALDQMELTGIYRTCHPKEATHTFFSNAHGTYSKIYNMTDTKQASTNSRKLKSYQAFSLTTRD